MTVGELRRIMKDVPDVTEIYMCGDAEGNEVSDLATIEIPADFANRDPDYMYVCFWPA